MLTDSLLVLQSTLLLKLISYYTNHLTFTGYLLYCMFLFMCVNFICMERKPLSSPESMNAVRWIGRSLWWEEFVESGVRKNRNS